MFIHVHPCSRFIDSDAPRLYKTRNCNFISMQKIPMHVFLKGTKVSCVHAKSVFLYYCFLIIILGTLQVVTSRRINEKKTKKMQIFTDDCPIYQI